MSHYFNKEKNYSTHFSEWPLFLVILFLYVVQMTPATHFYDTIVFGGQEYLVDKSSDVFVAISQTRKLTRSVTMVRI